MKTNSIFSSIIVCLSVVAVVCAQEPVVQIDVEKETNGVNADSPPGPYIPVGGTVVWRIYVNNTGNVLIPLVEVTDSQFGSVDVIDLGAGEIRVIQIVGTALAGQHSNLVTAVAKYDLDGDTVPEEVASDQDVSHYFGGEPGSEPRIPLLPVFALPAAFATIPLVLRKRKLRN